MSLPNIDLVKDEFAKECAPLTYATRMSNPMSTALWNGFYAGFKCCYAMGFQQQLTEAKAEIERLQAHNAMLVEALTYDGEPSPFGNAQNAIERMQKKRAEALSATAESTQQWFDGVKAQARAEVLEELDDFAQDALQSDLENGVKWLNEEAAKDFGSQYPNIAELIGKISRMASEVKPT